MNRRTLTMNWDGLGEEDDEDHFFEACQRISSFDPLDLGSSESDDFEEFEDTRMSFVSAISSASIKGLRSIDSISKPSNILAAASIKGLSSIDSISKPSCILGGYDMWMAEPGDIKERRKRLLQGMGLASNKDLLKIASTKIVRAISVKPKETSVPTVKEADSPSPAPDPDPSPSPSPSPCPTTDESKKDEAALTSSTHIVLVRSRSDGDIDISSAKTKQRKEELFGPGSKQRLTRTSSLQLLPSIGICKLSTNSVAMSEGRAKKRSSVQSCDAFADEAFGSFFLIKNLDTGKEFIVKEYNQEGMWNKLSDVQTGKQLTMEEFEKSVGYSPVVKELMRRQNGSGNEGRKINPNSLITKSFRNSKKKGAALLKNLTGVANSMSRRIVDKDQQEHSITPEAAQKPTKPTSQWVKTRQQGKSYKEFTALHMSQEIQAHEGSIWTIRFSCDAHYLASAGEDKVIHVWEVQDCDVMSTRPTTDDLSMADGGGTPAHPMAGNVSDNRPHLAEISPLPPGRQVVDWTDIHEMVTAACYTPDGQVTTHTVY